MICWEHSFPFPDWGPSTTPGRALRAWIFPWPSLAFAQHLLYPQSPSLIWRWELVGPSTRGVDSHLFFTPQWRPYFQEVRQRRDEVWDPCTRQRLPGHPLNYPEFRNKFDHVAPTQSNHSHCNTKQILLLKGLCYLFPYLFNIMRKTLVCVWRLLATCLSAFDKLEDNV